MNPFGGRKRTASTMLLEMDTHFIDLVSPPTKKRKLYHTVFSSKFTFQHFVSLHYCVISYQFDEPFPLHLIYFKIIQFINNIDPQLQYFYQRYIGLHNITLLAFNEIIESLKCEQCEYVFSDHGYIGSNDFLCNDCNELYCDYKCFNHAQHIFKCDSCSTKYCKTFYDDNAFGNDTRRCKYCQRFICMRCFDNEGEIVCNDCDESEPYNVFVTDVDRRTVEQRHEHLQHLDLTLKDDDWQEIDLLTDESYDDIGYGDKHYRSGTSHRFLLRPIVYGLYYFRQP
eukprot:267496_1